MADKLTSEEERIILALSRPPRCMHDPKWMTEAELVWICKKCGLIAPKMARFEPLGKESEEVINKNAWNLYEN